MTHTVYTCIVGNYEELKQPTIISEGWKYVCYTDQPLTSDIWEIRQIEVTLPAQRMARYIKINFHKFVETEFSLWLDASFQITCDLNIFWNKYFKSPFTAPAHPLRNCVYVEVRSCIANKRGDEVQIREQGEHYRKLKIPEFNGIITSGVLMRQNTEGCIKMCEQWWEELSKHSARDQIAFANISRRWAFGKNTFKWDYTANSELRYITHYKYRH